MPFLFKKSPSRFWRHCFAAVLVYTGLFGFLTIPGFLGLTGGTKVPFQPQRFGIFGATSLWAFWNQHIATTALFLINLVSLPVVWGLYRGVARPRRVLLYVSCSLIAAALNAVAVMYAAGIGTFSTPTATFVVTSDIAKGFAGLGAIYTFPAFLVILGRLLVGWSHQRAGHCPSCSYDLTGNTSGTCPECGFAVPPHFPHRIAKRSS